MSVFPDDVSRLFGAFQADFLSTEVELKLLITDFDESVFILESDVESVWTHVFFKMLVFQLS